MNVDLVRENVISCNVRIGMARKKTINFLQNVDYGAVICMQC